MRSVHEIDPSDNVLLVKNVSIKTICALRSLNVWPITIHEHLNVICNVLDYIIVDISSEIQSILLMIVNHTPSFVHKCFS